MCVIVSAANAAEVKRLTTENAVLRQDVERLKQELSAAEVRHGGLCSVHLSLLCRVQKTRGFFKSPTQWVFWGFIGFLGLIGFFLDKQEKIGKIIEKLSNLKP